MEVLTSRQNKYSPSPTAGIELPLGSLKLGISDTVMVVPGKLSMVVVAQSGLVKSARVKAGYCHQNIS